MKTAALAGILLVLAISGVAYHWAHHPGGSNSGEAAELSVSEASGQAPVGPGPATAAKWATVRDTRERAFSIQVPQGWKTYGGLFRFSAIDARLVVDMTSPDGLTNLRIGESTVPPYP